MRVEQQPAYVLHTRPYRETSLLIEAFTRDYGRIGIVARAVRGARSRFSRALLQAFQPISVSFSGRGELVVLTMAEAADSPWRLSGAALLCAMYINELVLRLTARNDANPEIYFVYEECLERLQTGNDLSLTLRRMERDLLKLLGYELMLDREFDSGRAVAADVDYAYDPDLGPRRWQAGMNGVRVRGSGLLALHTDAIPNPTDLGALKRLLRMVIAQHLGNFPLHAWEMLPNRRSGERD